MSYPPGYDRDMGVGIGQQSGGQTEAVNVSRCRYAARGAETSEGDWWAAGAGDVQVDVVLHR